MQVDFIPPPTSPALVPGQHVYYHGPHAQFRGPARYEGYITPPVFDRKTRTMRAGTRRRLHLIAVNRDTGRQFNVFTVDEHVTSTAPLN